MDFIYNMYLLNMKLNTHYICLWLRNTDLPSWLSLALHVLIVLLSWNCSLDFMLFAMSHLLSCVRDSLPVVCVWVRACKYRRGLCLQVLYVPDPEYVSSVGSSPSLSPISPLSPTSSEADLEKVTVCRPHLWRTISHARNIFLYG